MKKLIMLPIMFGLIILHGSFTNPNETPIKVETPAELEGKISLSGAFALYPLVVKWGEEFKKLHPKVQFDIQGGGAGKGMTDVLSNTVELGMVSREITADEAKMEQ